MIKLYLIDASLNLLSKIIYLYNSITEDVKRILHSQYPDETEQDITKAVLIAAEIIFTKEQME